jgi:hypothetical protein
MSGLNYLLDTNIIIGLYNRNAAILALLQDKFIRINQCAYSSITRMELLSYPDLTVSDKQSIESLLKNMTYLPISPEIEDETIKFRRTQLTKLPDSIIAATAKYYQLVLLTLDKKLASKL